MFCFHFVPTSKKQLNCQCVISYSNIRVFVFLHSFWNNFFFLTFYTLHLFPQLLPPIPPFNSNQPRHQITFSPLILRKPLCSIQGFLFCTTVICTYSVSPSKPSSLRIRPVNDSSVAHTLYPQIFFNK